MIKYVISYLSVEKNPKIYYLHLNGKFVKKPYRYFEGDDEYPDYYHAKWLELSEAVKVLDNLPVLTTKQGDIIPYRLIELNIKFIQNEPKNIPKWQSKLFGEW